MTFKYYAIVKGEVVDESNSLISLKNRMDEYVHSMPKQYGLCSYCYRKKESINRKIL